MKQCKHCGATIHDGDTFCRTCAMPVGSNNGIPEDINNIATNDFMAQSYSVPPAPEETYFQETQSSRITESKIGYHDDTSNKKYVNRDGNDRAKATLINFLGLAILLAIVGVCGFFLYDNVFKHMF